MPKLSEKIALITGSSSGIGRAVALAFAREGAHVAINYPDAAQEQKAAEVKKAIGELVLVGGSSCPFSAFVIPAEAGIYFLACVWIPACAGMTVWKAAASPSGQRLLPQCTRPQGHHGGDVMF